MIAGILYKSYFSNIAKIILFLIIGSWLVFIIFTLKEGTTLITKLSFGSALLLMFFGTLFVSNIKPIGEILFNKERLVIHYNYDVDEVLFLLDEIDNIYVYYEGYKNQDDSNIYRPLSFRDGTENEIGFLLNGKIIKYKFQILDERFLGRLIAQWKHLKEPKIRIYNKDQKSRIIWTNYK